MTGARREGLPGGVLSRSVWSIGFIALSAALLLWLMASASVSSQSTMMLGVDVSPGANHASSVGAIETCVSHDVGDEFAIDVFVNNVIGLTSFDLRLAYDSDVVQVTDADFNFFLVSTPPGGNVFPILFESELPGRQFIAAAEFQGPADSGSGVLARVSLAAVGKGTSDVSVVTSPVVLGPLLSSKTDGAIGDSDGDGRWDGSIVGGEVRVGHSCASGAPVITPKPSLAPGTTPDPGPGSGGDAVLAATSAPVVIIPGGGTDSGAGGSGNSDSDAETGSGSDWGPAGEDDGGTNPGDDRSGFDGDTDTDPDGDHSSANAADDGDSSSGTVLVVLGLAAAALALGALLYGFAQRFGH